MARDERTRPDPDVLAELRRLGSQLGETLDAAWKSAERQRAQEQLRAGARAFVDECESALERAGTARSADMASQARHSAVEALRWMSAELASLAERFTPADAGADRGRTAQRGERV